MRSLRPLLSLALASLVPGQTTETTPPPGAQQPRDRVVSTLESANRELRWLLDRNAALERLLAALREERNADQTRAARQIAELQAALAQQRQAQQANQ